MSNKINNISDADQSGDNISVDTSDVKDMPELVAAAQPQQPAVQQTEFEFGDLLALGKQMCGSDIKFKLEFDSQIVDGGKVVARKNTGEFMFSARLRYRNYGCVTNNQQSLVVPIFFSDLEKNEKLEIYVENNAEDKNKVESN
ncbi:hypothetical protein D5b_00381 [Faustovirus]|nr:hypothetical protein D5b_00381 [Faustovirus]AMN84534.1 hypothetical protein D6_00126 [Faustovirus]AMP44324.1 hypothetical protein PRJ_Dakar_00372 [Faustovirus]QKE50232.1 hypothetical protein F-VV10_0112 [Faustovirus]